MDIRITPRKLSGVITAPPSKSAAHRLIICAALSDAPVKMALPFLCEDIQATLSCVRTLGGDGVWSGGILTVSPVDRDPNSVPALDCGESGSTARFLLPVAAALRVGSVITGRGRLPQRPFDPIVRAIAPHGTACAGTGLPARLSGRLEAGDYFIEGNVSSQYISGLLFALPLLDGDSRIHLTSRLSSVNYIDMTLAALRTFGVRADRTDDGWSVPGGQNYISPGTVKVEGDWSNSANLLVMGALGGDIGVTGLDSASLQGDRAISDILTRMGAVLTVQGGCLRAAAPDGLRAADVDAANIPDLVPAFAAAAACADGESHVFNCARLRLKESDRIESVLAMLSSFGIEAQADRDSLTIRGGRPCGGRADSFNDHRIVMASAVLASFSAGPVTIERADAVNKSWPRFFDDYKSLGGKADVIDIRQ